MAVTFWTIAGAVGCFIVTALGKIGIILQKKAVTPPVSSTGEVTGEALPEFTLFKWTVLKRYFTNKFWMLGLLVDIAAGVTALLALSSTPVTICQPISFSGVAVITVMGHFFLRERLILPQWIAVGFLFVGGALIATTIENQDDLLPSATASIVTWAAGLVAALIVEVILIPLKTRSPQIAELLAALQIGMLAACGVISITATLRTYRLGHKPLWWLILVIQIAGWPSVCMVIAQQRAFRFARASVVNAYSTVLTLIGVVLLGLLVLDETWPAAQWASAARIVGFVVLAAAMFTFNWFQPPSTLPSAGVVEAIDVGDSAAPVDAVRSDTATDADVEKGSPTNKDSVSLNSDRRGDRISLLSAEHPQGSG